MPRKARPKPRKKAPTRNAARARRTDRAGNERSVPLKEKAYQLIKHRIITCAFKPGETLNEAEVADMLRLGRTPINQAFDRLRLESLVDVMPRKGIVVRHIDFDEVLQISEARILNEAYAVRLAAERATASEIAAMREVLAEAQRRKNDLERFIMLDREFHLMIADAARNDVIADVLRNLNERSLRLWSISLADEAHKVRVSNEHDEIFKAIFHRNPAEAERWMRQHIDSFKQIMLRKLPGSREGAQAHAGERKRQPLKA